MSTTASEGRTWYLRRPRKAGDIITLNNSLPYLVLKDSVPITIANTTWHETIVIGKVERTTDDDE